MREEEEFYCLQPKDRRLLFRIRLISNSGYRHIRGKRQITSKSTVETSVAHNLRLYLKIPIVTIKAIVERYTSMQRTRRLYKDCAKNVDVKCNSNLVLVIIMSMHCNADCFAVSSCRALYTVENALCRVARERYACFERKRSSMPLTGEQGGSKKLTLRVCYSVYIR